MVARALIRALVPPEDVDLAIAAAWSSMHGIAALALDGRLGVPPSGLEKHVRQLCSYLAMKLKSRT